MEETVGLDVARFETADGAVVSPVGAGVPPPPPPDDSGVGCAIGAVDVAVAVGVVDVAVYLGAVAASSFGVAGGAMGTILVVLCIVDSGVIAGEVI